MMLGDLFFKKGKNKKETWKKRLKYILNNTTTNLVSFPSPPEDTTIIDYCLYFYFAFSCIYM